MHDLIWGWYMSGADLLCVACAAKRLGRPVRPDDFKRIPCKQWVFDAFEDGLDPMLGPHICGER